MGFDANIQADFWTSPYPYWNMKDLAPEVFGGLKDSGLVIFKVSKVSGLVGVSRR